MNNLEGKQSLKDVTKVSHKKCQEMHMSGSLFVGSPSPRDHLTVTPFNDYLLSDKKSSKKLILQYEESLQRTLSVRSQIPEQTFGKNLLHQVVYTT